MEQETDVLATTEDTAPPAAAPVPTTDATADELLIEEISIDGMCGVY
jgi:mycofactocin precursor